MTTNNNTDHAADLRRSVFVEHTILYAKDQTDGVIGSEKARAAYEDLIAPIVFQLNKLMKEKLGRNYSATLKVLGTCFNGRYLQAGIVMSGPPLLSRTIQLLVADPRGRAAMFSLWGSERILEDVSFELSKDSISVFYETRTSTLPGERAFGGGEYVRFDTTAEVLEFISDKLKALVAD